MAFYAHSTQRRDHSDWQGLAEHLNGVGERASVHAEAFGGQVMARVAGQLHDLGKYTEKFQARLAGDPTRVDHATWGARKACELYRSGGTLLAYGIAGHHAGLADGRRDDLTSRPSLHERLSDEYCAHALPPLLPDWEREVMLPAKLELPTGFRGHPRTERRAFQMTVLPRMLFSCLVDADFVDTDDFYRRVEGRKTRAEQAGTRLTLEELRERLDSHLPACPASTASIRSVRPSCTKPGLRRTRVSDCSRSLSLPAVARHWLRLRSHWITPSPMVYAE